MSKLYTFLIIMSVGLSGAMWAKDLSEGTIGRYDRYAQLRDRRYNEVAFPASHNAQSYKGSAASNQDMSITEQLNSGIRAIKVPVWFDRDSDGKPAPFACHGLSKDFLERPYLELLIDKLPSMVQSFARKLMKDMEPVNGLIKDAIKAAYGKDGEQGAIPFAHCVFDPSRQPLRLVLKEINAFLDKNPNEIFTLILEDHTRNLDAIADLFKKSGLDKHAHMQDINKPWPTLEHMINSKKRLVVFLHGDQDLPYKKHPSLHYVWDFAWDTEWDFSRACDLNNPYKDCMPKRGKPIYVKRNNACKNKVFLVYHFVTTRSCGSKSCARQVNRKSCLMNRLNRLAKQAGQIPNIVQVDFFQYPNNDIFAAIDELNGVAK